VPCSVRCTCLAAFLLALSPLRAGASGLAPGIVTEDGELLLTLGRSAILPVLALVGPAGRLSGVLHRAREPEGDTAPRLVVVDDAGRFRIVLGRYTSLDGRVKCHVCVALLDAEQRSRAVLDGARLLLLDPEGNETDKLDAGPTQWVALVDSRGVIRARSRRGNAYLLDEKGGIQAMVVDDESGPVVGAGPVRMGSQTEAERGTGVGALTGLPPPSARPDVRLFFSDRKARDREVQAIRWSVPVVDFPDGPMRVSRQNVPGGVALRIAGDDPMKPAPPPKKRPAKKKRHAGSD